MQFQPGQSGNPAGRPPGSRNKKTLALEAAFDDRAEEILDDVVARAKDGEKTAMRLCMERIMAPKRERPVAIVLPPIETPADARKALAVVTAELGEGTITIGEASKLIALIDRMVRMIERVTVLEQKQRDEKDKRDAMRRIAEQMLGREIPVETEEEQEEQARQAPEAGCAADPSLYFPVNSENAGAADGPGAALALGRRTPDPSEGPPLARAA
jgi:hypothetical protein